MHRTYCIHTLSRPPLYHSNTCSPTLSAPPSPPALVSTSAQHMYNLMSEMEDPNYGAVLQDTLKNLSGTREGRYTALLLTPSHMHSHTHIPSHMHYHTRALMPSHALSHARAHSETVKDLFSNIDKKFESDHKVSFLPQGPDDKAGIQSTDREVAETLAQLAKAQNGMQGMETGKMEDVGETMMEDMMAQFQALGDKEDYHDVIDGVMRQLLAKDLMYDPIRQVRRR